jgi:coenzyme Q-binding protein COQ10
VQKKPLAKGALIVFKRYSGFPQRFLPGIFLQGAVSVEDEGKPIRYARSAVLPYAPERIFDLVADIERYPEFLEEYRDARIRSRDGETLHVDQVIGFAFVEVNLSAVATLRRPDSIIVRSHQGMLGDLEIRWGFKPAATGTRVEFRMELTPPSRFAAGITGYLLTKSAARTLEAFAARARQVYGA